MHPSTFLALSGSSEGLVLVTLGVRQHLDGLVVFGGSDRQEIIGGSSPSSCDRLWAIHRAGVAKNQPVESTLPLRG